jgi:hypothetical protein
MFCHLLYSRYCSAVKKNMPLSPSPSQAYNGSRREEVTTMVYEDDLEEMILTGVFAEEMPEFPDILHAEPGAYQAIKDSLAGHGEQTVLPDDCQFGDNDLCFVEA